MSKSNRPRRYYKNFAKGVLMKSKKENITQLLDQIIERAELEDLNYKKAMLYANKGSQAQGDSFIVHHLKILKSEIKDLN